jgi:hypothetical protein
VKAFYQTTRTSWNYKTIKNLVNIHWLFPGDMNNSAFLMSIEI